MEQRLRYTDLSPEGIAPMRALEHFLNAAAGLDRTLVELVRLRVSLINGCAYCIGLHGHELQKANETPDRIAAVAFWREHPDLYTHREQAAFAWAEAITNIQESHASDEAYEAVRSHFPDSELVNLTLVITSINSWNRLAIAFRAQKPAKAEQPHEDDGGKVSVED